MDSQQDRYFEDPTYANTTYAKVYSWDAGYTPVYD